MSKRPQNLKLDRQLARFAALMWLVAWCLVSILVWRRPLWRSDCGVYSTAALDWWAGKSLYAHNFGIDGFLYLPQFALSYTPFALMGHPIGDMAWRAVGLGLLATGLWRMAKIVSAERALIIFAFSTAMVLPPSVASLRNGQANLHIAGLMLHAAADLRYGKWGRAALGLVAGVVIKPIIIVMVLLSAAVYRPMIARVIVGLALVLALPFAFGNPHYVMDQYRGYAQVLHVSSQPPGLYCNMRGLLGKMGWTMGQPTLQAMSMAAAAAMLGFCLIARTRWPEPARVFFLLGFAAVYLMLFNPRTESNSYVMLAPIIAIPGALLMFELDRPAAAWWMFGLSLMLVCDGWAYVWTENWLKPLTCTVVWVLLIRELLRTPQRVWQVSAGLGVVDSARVGNETKDRAHEMQNAV